MKHTRLILITLILLNARNLYNQEPLLQVPQNTIDDLENLLKPSDSNQTTEQTTPIEEKNSLDAWDQHLDLLTIKEGYWDASNTIPLDSWKDDAFTIAERIVSKDAALADTLKTSFFDAISQKVLLETKDVLKKGTSAYKLTEEFDQMVDNAIQPPVIETPQETTQPTPPPIIVPEVTTSEPVVSEPAPLPQTDETTTAQEATTASQSSEQTSESLKQKWQEQLEKLKDEDENWVRVNKVLDDTYEAAKELLGQPNAIKENVLEAQFLGALQARAAKTSKRHPLDINESVTLFKNAIGIFTPYSYPQQPMVAQNDVRRQEEFAARESQLEEQLKKLEQQQEEDKEKSMIELKALIDAQKEGARTTGELHASIKEQKDREAAFTKAHEKLEKDMKDIRASYAQQLAAAQKPVAPAPTPAKGVFSAITDPLYNWWYGINPAEQATATIRSPMTIQQEDLLNKITKGAPDQNAAKTLLKIFDNHLLRYNAQEYWDPQHKRPDDKWINIMQDLVKNIVIEQKIMSLDAVEEIVTQFLISSPETISTESRKKIITEIGTLVHKERAAQQRQKDAEEQIAQQKRDKKEQILLAQQRIKDEQDRIAAEEQRKKHVAISYKDQKKDWYEFLFQLRQNKNATEQDNHKLTQEALQRSQSLLQLAGDIPNKNKKAISQKLKQKFSLALLNQQKNNQNLINIHKNMDSFNQEINRIID